MTERWTFVEAGNEVHWVMQSAQRRPTVCVCVCLVVKETEKWGYLHAVETQADRSSQNTLISRINVTERDVKPYNRIRENEKVDMNLLLIRLFDRPSFPEVPTIQFTCNESISYLTPEQLLGLVQLTCKQWKAQEVSQLMSDRQGKAIRFVQSEEKAR